jgi:hypothetical protein
MFRKQHPEYYEYNENIHNYNTRNISKSVVPKLSKNLIEKILLHNYLIFFLHESFK